VRTPPLAIGEHRTARGRSLAAPRRPRRSRRGAWLGLGATLLVLGLLGGAAWWVLTAPAFAVARVQTGPYRYAAEPAVERALGQALGRNIWTLPADAVRESFAAVPWVRDVSLGRRLPDVLTVRLQEWQPRLLLAGPADDPTPRALVGDGRVLPWPQHLPVPGLPWLEGAQARPAGDGTWRLAAPRAARLLQVLEAVAATGLEQVAPLDFVRITDTGLELVLQGDGGRLQVGREDFTARLERYLLGRERVPTGAVVDLRFEDRITFVPPPGP
jgi:hypothetical protein